MNRLPRLNARGAYTMVVAVLAVALLGIALASSHFTKIGAPNFEAAYDAKPVWVNALALVQDEVTQAACAHAGPADAGAALALLDKETGFDCATTPAQIPVNAEQAAFELACEKKTGALEAKYARTVALPAAGC